MSGAIPALLRGLVDDAAVFPPGNAALEDAVAAHRVHRASWYSEMVGPLLVPASRLPDLDPGRGELEIGVVVDCELQHVAGAVAQLDPRVAVVGYESRAAVQDLVAAAKDWDAPVCAELPFEEDALDSLVGTGLIPKFRTGGPAAESFPSPRDLAAVLVGCARRAMRCKLTAGLHRAVRHTDAGTGFVHHGFLNVMAASAEAAAGAGVEPVARLLASTDAGKLVERTRSLLDRPRPLWNGFGSCSIAEPLEDLTELSLLTRGGNS